VPINCGNTPEVCDEVECLVQFAIRRMPRLNCDPMLPSMFFDRHAGSLRSASTAGHSTHAASCGYFGPNARLRLTDHSIRQGTANHHTGGPTVSLPKERDH